MSRDIPPGKRPSRRPHRHPNPDDGRLPHRGRLLARLADPTLRGQIKAASVVIGSDARGTGRFSIFFGLATLERHREAGRDLKASVVTVPVDFATDDVEVLYAFCVTQKGSCCYNRGQHINPNSN